MMKGLLRHHPRKGKPAARLGRKAKGRLDSEVRQGGLQLSRAGCLAAERMLAVAFNGDVCRIDSVPTRG
jgi:hypothetical protein